MATGMQSPETADKDLEEGELSNDAMLASPKICQKFQNTVLHKA
jgi:hypothetical protein